MDPPNPPQTPSQKVLGALGTCKEAILRVWSNSSFNNMCPGPMFVLCPCEDSQRKHGAIDQNSFVSGFRCLTPNVTWTLCSRWVCKSPQPLLTKSHEGSCLNFVFRCLLLNPDLCAQTPGTDSEVALPFLRSNLQPQLRCAFMVQLEPQPLPFRPISLECLSSKAL